MHTHPVAVTWEWQDRAGLDAARLAATPDGGHAITGHAVIDWDGALLDLRYAVTLDAGFVFREARVSTALGDRSHQLVLRRDPVSGWTADGVPRPDLATAVDIDIMATPSTNTLPVRRVLWPDGVPQEFTMAYIRLPALDVVPVAQRYTRLSPGRFLYELTPGAPGTEGGRTGYHSPEGGFRAEIDVDAAGLVIAYPPYWRRAGL